MPLNGGNTMATRLQVVYDPDYAELRMSFRVIEVHRDLTPGKIYSARRPNFGERGPRGLPVKYSDELWIYADDAGKVVVTRMGFGFQPVQ